MLKKVPDNQKEISREDNNNKDLNPLKTSSNKEFQFIKNIELGQEIKE